MDGWTLSLPRNFIRAVEKGMQLECVECNSHYFFNTKLQNMQYWCHFPIKFHLQIFFWGILLTIFVVVWVLSVVQGSWVLGLSTARRFLLYFSFYFIISYGCTSCQAWNSWVKLFPSCSLRKPSPKPVLCIKSVLFFFKMCCLAMMRLGNTVCKIWCIQKLQSLLVMWFPLVGLLRLKSECLQNVN